MVLPNTSSILRERPLSAPFLAAAALMLVLKVLFDLQPQDFPLRDQASAFAWPAVLLALSLAFAGRFAERSLGWPWIPGDGTLARAGLLYASIAGAVYGVITIAQFSLTQGAHPLAESEWAHVPLPWSVPFYLYGTLFLEFVLRLGCLTILTWGLYVVLLRRRLPNTVFWSVNILVSLFEIWPYLARDIDRERLAECRGNSGSTAFPLQCVRGLAAPSIWMASPHRVQGRVLPVVACSLRRHGEAALHQ